MTTGEILLRPVRIGEKQGGQTLVIDVNGRPEVRIDLEGTFPLAFAEVVSGDGVRVYRDRIDVSTTPPFARSVVVSRPDLRGRRWARVEVWDVARNGAFSQPIWIEGGPR